ncbi:hypothetical protein ACA910_018756 [Epithemia clementina (nom. ined.)]
MVLSSFTAAEYGDVHSLLRREGLAKKRDAAGNTPLHLAAQHGHVAATAALLAAGCHPNGYHYDNNDNNDSVGATQQDDGTTIAAWFRQERLATPLHRASFSGAVATMHLLLTTTNNNYNYNNNNKNCCHLLIPDYSFGDGQTPLHKAVSGGRPLALQLLLDAHRQQNSLREALTVVDAAGRTCLQLAQDLVNQCYSLERARVARWNAVAGGEPDWKQCRQLLQNAAHAASSLVVVVEEEDHSTSAVVQSSIVSCNSSTTEAAAPPPPSPQPTPTRSLPTPDKTNQPQPQSSTMDYTSYKYTCLDENCDSQDDGTATCLTASWERSFWMALSQNTKKMAASPSPATEGKREPTAHNAQQLSDAPSSTATTTTTRTAREQTYAAVNYMACDAIKEDAVLPNAATTQSASSITSSAIGAPCTHCGTLAIALYPLVDDTLVCKPCLRRHRQRQLRSRRRS